LQRIARNQARLRTLGFDKPKDEETKKKKVPSKPKPSYDGPRRELPGRAKRATFNDTVPVRGERRVEEKKNMDICYLCQKEDAGECFIMLLGVLTIFICSYLKLYELIYCVICYLGINLYILLTYHFRISKVM